MKNILITGGAGFVGSNLAISLISKGYNVRVLDNLSHQIHGVNPILTSPLYRSIYNKVEMINGSVTSKHDWVDALEGQDTIVHLAAETGTGQSMYQIESYNNTNVVGTALMLDILANEKSCVNVNKVVLASSRAIYGEGKYYCSEHGEVFPLTRRLDDLLNGDFECKCPTCRSEVKLISTTEDSMIHPNSIYGITKQNQEQMILMMCDALGIDSVSLRYQNVYGPGQSLKNPYTGILSIFSNIILNKGNINIFEDGLESRDFVYIDDVVDATILAIEKDTVGSKIFNIGSGIPTTVIDIAMHLQNCFDVESSLFISGNFRVGDIRHCYADLRLSGLELGYKPQVRIKDGIKSFAEWVLKQDVEPSMFEASYVEMKEKNLLRG